MAATAAGAGTRGLTDLLDRVGAVVDRSFDVVRGDGLAEAHVHGGSISRRG